MAYIPSRFLNRIARHEIEGTYLHLCDLSLTTGKVVASDPWVFSGHSPFEQTVSAGRYKVELLLKDYNHQGQYSTVCAAILWLSDAPPTSFILATLPGQDTKSLGDDQFFGHGVDSGMSCFMDIKAAELMKAHDTSLSKDPHHISFYDTFVYPLMENQDNWSWLELQPYPDNPLNIAAFQSGHGDGFYASYWGLNDQKQVICLITDFGVLDET